MKRYRIALIALAIILSFTLTAFAQENTRDFSFETSLATDLKALSLFGGVSENDFDLERAPTRVEVLVMLIRVLGEESTALEKQFEHPFTDVPDWADPYVGYAYETGLTKGMSETKFGTGEASAATYLTFMLRALGFSDAEGDFRWDAPEELARGIGILPSYVDTENFLRADIVTISYAALYAEINDSNQLLCEKLIEKNVFSADTFAKNYTAYKITDKENESKYALVAEQIYEECSPAVFYIEIQTKDGIPISSGSGFFIDESGIAVTNHHVMEQAEKAVITLSDSGLKYDVSGIYYYSLEHDIAVIGVDGSGFDTLKVNPFPAKGASTVFAIGSPQGLQNTISQGLISNVRRVIDNETYMQTTAAISGGSSGGVLLNVYGEVIGITSAGYNSGQNLNFVRPIYYLAHATTDKLTALADVNWNSVEYTLREESYTLAAGEKLSFEFDCEFYTVDSKVPQFKAVSDNPDVVVAESGFGDTFVNLVGVAPGTANVTISDDISNDTITFTVTVTEGNAKVQPYVEYFTDINDSLGLNKGANKTVRLSAVSVGAGNEAEWSVRSSNSTVVKVSNTKVEDGYFSFDITAVKSGRADVIVKCGITEDALVIPVTVGEQYYVAFDAIKDYAVANGEFFDDDDNAKDFYRVDGRIYSNGDVTYIQYYPESDKIYFNVDSLVSTVTVDLVLSRTGPEKGKKIEFEILYPAYEFSAKAVISNPESFGDGKSDSVVFTEYEGEESTKKWMESSSVRSVVMILREFDQWFRYIIPGIDAGDLGFVKINYDFYGVNFIV